MALTRLGFHFSSTTYAGWSSGDLFSTIAEVARAAEDAGFESVWIPDSLTWELARSSGTQTNRRSSAGGTTVGEEDGYRVCETVIEKRGGGSCRSPGSTRVWVLSCPASVRSSERRLGSCASTRKFTRRRAGALVADRRPMQAIQAITGSTWSRFGPPVSQRVSAGS